MKKSIEHFQRAIELDPDYALAYAGLADAYNSLGVGYSDLSPTAAFSRAKTATQRALEIDNTLAEAHSALGFIALNYDWDWSGAETEFKRAIELNPNLADAHLLYAEYLSAMGRIEEALAEARRGEELDPLSPTTSETIGIVLYMARKYDLSMEYQREAVEVNPAFWSAHMWLGVALAHNGLYSEAIEALTKA